MQTRIYVLLFMRLHSNETIRAEDVRVATFGTIAYKEGSAPCTEPRRPQHVPCTQVERKRGHLFATFTGRNVSANGRQTSRTYGARLRGDILCDGKGPQRRRARAHRPGHLLRVRSTRWGSGRVGESKQTDGRRTGRYSLGDADVEHESKEELVRGGARLPGSKVTYVECELARRPCYALCPVQADSQVCKHHKGRNKAREGLLYNHICAFVLRRPKHKMRSRVLIICEAADAVWHARARVGNGDE
ncbi:hypothetical protein BDW22DRAFT_852604 [Trametopsis cervina]|nr:hypothetical protein BDW22DRAFT_852604 [Trametopsis cervina]